MECARTAKGLGGKSYLTLIMPNKDQTIQEGERGERTIALPRMYGKTFTLDKFIKEQEDLDPEISKLVDKNFWDLIT